MTEIKACKPFRDEDVVNYCITAIVYNAGTKAEVLDKFCVWAPSIIKEKISESFKVFFHSCASVQDSDCLTNMTQIYASIPLE